MRDNFVRFAHNKLRDFGQALINIFIFLPYFFSVTSLIKTLFYPWKNLVSVKKTAGFSFSEWANRLIFNLISRTIGLIMRISIVLFYFIFQTIYMLTLPFIALGYFVLLPLMYVEYLFQKTPEELRETAKQKFVAEHNLDPKNHLLVENWFDDHYKKHVFKSKWWELKNLMETPPLARDWSSGFTPIIDQYTIDLATPSYLHHIKNIVDRNSEISEIERNLSKDAESNVIIVGEEGVGKHTIIDALAKKIYLGRTTPQLMYKRILKLNMERVFAEFSDFPKRESFFEDLLKEASDAHNIILFIDDFEKYTDQASLFKKFSTSSNLQIIGVTNPYAFEKDIFSNEKIARLFQKIEVHEVKREEALSILLDTAFEFEQYHQVVIPYETLADAVDKSEFYMTYIPFPEKAVDLLDAACVYAKSQKIKTVTPEIIGKTLSEKTHVPTLVTTEMKTKLLTLEEKLNKQVIQQNHAIDQLSSGLRRSFLLMGKRKKPLATFLFLGPTGVGKTETAKAIAKTFFGDERLTRFDMSLYQSKNDIPKLIGDPLFSQPGLLSASIREKPYGVLLLDEIEKANGNLLNIFLTILDEGYFFDGTGRRVDCKNLLIIATSNAASDVIYKNKNIDLVDYLVENKIFSPEFINRFDAVIAYESLTRQSIEQMARQMVGKIVSDVSKLYKVNVKVGEDTIGKLASIGYDPRFGARNLERALRDGIENEISKKILSGAVGEGETLTI